MPAEVFGKQSKPEPRCGASYICTKVQKPRHKRDISVLAEIRRNHTGHHRVDSVHTSAEGCGKENGYNGRSVVGRIESERRNNACAEHKPRQSKLAGDFFIKKYGELYNSDAEQRKKHARKN